jgi:DNA-binding IclR family transcriptional regulator
MSDAANSAGQKGSYAAPALDKGLEILELLSRTETPLLQKDIAGELGRTVGEIYRMLACLVRRNYVAQIDDSYLLTAKLFELAHVHPPTHRLLIAARPIMQRLSSDLDQSCHLTVYDQGRQIVIAKIDTPSGMGFSVRVGSELDVLVSVSGRVLLAFQDDETRRFRIEESLQRRPNQADPQVESVLKYLTERGYESAPSTQVRGLYAVSFPILDTQGHAIAALSVPYAERIDQVYRKSIPEVQTALAAAATLLSDQVGRRVSASISETPTDKPQRRATAR